MCLAMKFPDFSEAACAGIGVESFFEDEETGTFLNLQAVKKVCAFCPIQDTCAEWGIHHEKYGIWGGLTPHERRELRKKRNILVVDPKTLANLGYSKGVPR